MMVPNCPKCGRSMTGGAPHGPWPVQYECHRCGTVIAPPTHGDANPEGVVMAKRKNNPLFQVGTVEVVDTQTGEAVPVEGGGLRMLPGPPGSCEWCHVAHAPTEPHNRDSPPYQMKFHTLHKRYPTWTDAMAHCTPEVRWRGELVALMTKHGLEIPDDLK